MPFAIWKTILSKLGTGGRDYWSKRRWSSPAKTRHSSVAWFYLRSKLNESIVRTNTNKFLFWTTDHSRAKQLSPTVALQYRSLLFQTKWKHIGLSYVPCKFQSSLPASKLHRSRQWCYLAIVIVNTTPSNFSCISQLPEYFYRLGNTCYFNVHFSWI